MLSKKFYSLKVDFAFKYIMRNPKVIRGFLGAVLGVDPEEITDIQYKDTHLGKGTKREKESNLDVRLTIMGKRRVNVELQMKPHKYWVNRSLYYNTKMFVRQGRMGSFYGEFYPCIHVGVLGYDYAETEQKLFTKVRLQDAETGKEYSDKLMFYVIQLNQAQYVKEEDRNELYYWASLINADSWEEYRMIAKGNEYLEEAVAELEKINLDPDQEEEYFLRELALMDERSLRKWSYEDGKKAGMEAGEKAGKRLMAELGRILLAAGESDLFLNAAEDEELQNRLFEKFELI